MVETTDFLSTNSTSCLHARTTVNLLMIPPLCSRGYYLKILTLWEPCQLRLACCCWMLPSKELLDLHNICVCMFLCRKEVSQGLSRTSCKGLIPAIRKKSFVQSIFPVSLVLKEQQDQFVSFRFCEVWHVQPTDQSCSNQHLLIILGSCSQGFDLKSVAVQTLKGQTTGNRRHFCIS